MCESCDDENAGDRQFIKPDASLIAAARAIEADMPGERAPERAWAIFASFAGGAIEWRFHHRIRVSFDAALAAADASSRVSRMRCEAVP
jgi:hypothetical protein